jgi:hypothetical protein
MSAGQECLPMDNPDYYYPRYNKRFDRMGGQMRYVRGRQPGLFTGAGEGIGCTIKVMCWPSMDSVMSLYRKQTLHENEVPQNADEIRTPQL